MSTYKPSDRIFVLYPAENTRRQAEVSTQVTIPAVVGMIEQASEIRDKPYYQAYIHPDKRLMWKEPSFQSVLKAEIAAKRPKRALHRRFVHWLGHVLVGMDCGVAICTHTQHLYCKTCGYDVTMPSDLPVTAT